MPGAIGKRTRWDSEQADRTAVLAEMVVRHAGERVKLPGWLLPLLVCELWDMHGSAFSPAYYWRLKERARDMLTKLLTTEEQSAIAAWFIHSESFNNDESDPGQ